MVERSRGPATRGHRPRRARGQSEAEWAYASSIALQQFGMMEQSIESAREAYRLAPRWAPAVLTLASIEYQLNRPEEGWRLLRSLLPSGGGSSRQSPRAPERTA